MKPALRIALSVVAVVLVLYLVLTVGFVVLGVGGAS